MGTAQLKRRHIDNNSGINFHIDLYCGYLSESPQQADFNKYPPLMVI